MVTAISGIDRLELEQVKGVDLLEKFELFRRNASASDHASFRPAEVKIPSNRQSTVLILVAYIENGEKALSQEGRPTFRSGRHDGSEFWGVRGFFDYHPRYSNAISTGAYWGTVVVLQIDAWEKFKVWIEWDTTIQNGFYTGGLRNYFETLEPHK